ncbi:TPA: transposase [Candidatus Poribacteria bacterium]|nr:transposase [Candidatus Poribacteria bacterium]HIA11432.1 transposase [Flavobacteriales bacterium]
MGQKHYNTDLTDQKWQCLQPHLPNSGLLGVYLRQWNQRLVFNVICYLVVIDYHWRTLTKDFPLCTTTITANSARRFIGRWDLETWVLNWFECQSGIAIQHKGKGFQVLAKR